MLTRRDLLVAAVAAAGTIAAVALAQTTGAIMKSRTIEWNSLQPVPQTYGARREVFKSRTATMDELEVHVTTLNPGAAPHEPHHHPEEELVILKEGSVDCMQNGLTNHVGPGGIIFNASNETHGVRNNGTTPATYYVIQFVPPGLKKAEAP